MLNRAAEAWRVDGACWPSGRANTFRAMRAYTSSTAGASGLCARARLPFPAPLHPWRSHLGPRSAAVSGDWSSGPYLFGIYEQRAFAAAAPLPNGDVLLAGGKSLFEQPLQSVQSYDQASGTWGLLGQMNEPREFAVAAALSNGEVLVAGGQNVGGYLSTAETYDPATNTWTAVASMLEAREGAAAG